MNLKSGHILRFALLALAALLFFSCEKKEEEKVIERGTVTDVDGNVYSTVKIGDQWWMAENLRVTRFNDGTSIVASLTNGEDAVWSDSAEPMYCAINDSIFGLLYNGNVITSEKNIAPQGWHVPSDAEWKKLEETIGMNATSLQALGWRGSDEAEKLISKYSKGWPDGGVAFGTDAYGFNALPGGNRIWDGRMNTTTNMAFWWTSSISGSDLMYRYIDANRTQIFRQALSEKYGLSIRCIKD